MARRRWLPRLFQRQLAGGAWGIAAATAHQTRIAYAHGVRRVLMANQLVGKRNMAILAELLADPPFEFFCLGGCGGPGRSACRLLRQGGAPGFRC
ncbi:hypothetical protein ACU4HD_43465 [Cupriavidus basilensis]